MTASSFGGALSGRDLNAVTKTVSGLLKLIHPSPDEPVPDEDLEWTVRLALECRRRVKEQQKRHRPRGVSQHALQPIRWGAAMGSRSSWSHTRTS